MTDIFTRERHSAITRRVRGVDTIPENRVRKLAHLLGYRFRLHRKDLPGRPDLLFRGRRVALFVHGATGTVTPVAPARRRRETLGVLWSIKGPFSI
jgi:DNA mismatch endonuclease (patch repair protein)